MNPSDPSGAGAETPAPSKYTHYCIECGPDCQFTSAGAMHFDAYGHTPHTIEPQTPTPFDHPAEQELLRVSGLLVDLDGETGFTSCSAHVADLILRLREAGDADADLDEELFACGCVREARWNRCEAHQHLEHDEEPTAARASSGSGERSDGALLEREYTLNHPASGGQMTLTGRQLLANLAFGDASRAGSGESSDTEVTDAEVDAFAEAYFLRGPSEDFVKFADWQSIQRRIRLALNALLASRAGSGERPEPSEAWGEPVQFVCDDGDTGDGLRLQIMPGGNGDWYVGIVQPGDRMAIRGVRIATSGGAASTVPRLGPAIADAYRAMLAAAGKSRGTVILPTREPAPASPNSGASGSTTYDVGGLEADDETVAAQLAADAAWDQRLAETLPELDTLAAKARRSVSPASGDAGSETPRLSLGQDWVSRVTSQDGPSVIGRAAPMPTLAEVLDDCERAITIAITSDEGLDGADGEGALRLIRAARVSRDGGTPPTMVERVAKAIYDAMRDYDHEGQRHPWVEGGNSLKQDEARSRAREALEPFAAAPSSPATCRIYEHDGGRHCYTHGTDWNADEVPPVSCAEASRAAPSLSEEERADTARLDWWFAHGLDDSVMDGSVDLWWADDEAEKERVTHGTSLRDALDKAMRGIYEPETSDG